MTFLSPPMLSPHVLTQAPLSNVEEILHDLNTCGKPWAQICWNICSNIQTFHKLNLEHKNSVMTKCLEKHLLADLLDLPLKKC